MVRFVFFSPISDRLGRGRFEECRQIVLHADLDGSLWKELTFNVFDAPHLLNAPFEERIKYLKERVIANKNLAIVNFYKCEGSMLEKLLLQTLQGGGEGLTLRKPGFFYQPASRSSSILKLKVGRIL